MNKFAAKLRKLENAVTDRINIWAPENTIKSSSFGINWLFGKSHGIPLGYSILSWGKQKAGKSVLGFDLAGQVHKKWNDSIVIKFDTEFRDEGQLDNEHAQAYGIDLDRYIPFRTNTPAGVFDLLNKEVLSIIQDGGNVKLIIIDSISALLGRKTATLESINDFTIGDHAQTLQIGLQSIRAMLFNHRIALYLTAHARAEMDRLEIMRGNKERPAAANAVMHLCEFVINVERNYTKTGNQDELENKLVDESKLDMTDDAERLGHKMRFFMQGSTLGPANRVAEATFDYQKGFINQHEEVFRIGKNWGVITRPTARAYKIGNEDFDGKPSCLNALASRKDLQQFVMNGILEREKTVGCVEIPLEQAEKEFEEIAR